MDVVIEEIPVIFKCHTSRLIGILHKPNSRKRYGVVVVVGGPQYRVGSHRQFVLLARFLAERGFPTLRFDYAGMGDSDGEVGNFLKINDDIACSIDQIYERTPGLDGVILWGLCDAASAIMMYGYKDERVAGMVLLNPWARTDAGMAKTYLRHYYLKKLVDKTFWKHLVTGKLNFLSSVSDFFSTLRESRGSTNLDHVNENQGERDSTDSFISLMEAGLTNYKGRVLFIFSGDDLTAREFRDLVDSSSRWRRLLKSTRVQTRELIEANHTFSKNEWRRQVEDWTVAWIEAN